MATYDMRRVSPGTSFINAFAVRRDVFIDEQDVDPDIEMDGKDDEATHFVAYNEVDGRPVGTARLHVKDEDTAKPERVAVRKPHRGSGIGQRLMAAIEAEAVDQGCTRAVLHAQTAVEDFYEDLGYETISDEFVEAEIPHVEMAKSLV
jgi:predicted GNAT family N-acyltransferase